MHKFLPSAGCSSCPFKDFICLRWHTEKGTALCRWIQWHKADSIFFLFPCTIPKILFATLATAELRMKNIHNSWRSLTWVPKPVHWWARARVFHSHGIVYLLCIVYSHVLCIYSCWTELPVHCLLLQILNSFWSFSQPGRCDCTNDILLSANHYLDTHLFP